MPQLSCSSSSRAQLRSRTLTPRDKTSELASWVSFSYSFCIFSEVVRNGALNHSVDAMTNHILLFSDTSKLFSKDNLEEEEAPISRPVSVGKLRVGNVYQVNV